MPHNDRHLLFSVLFDSLVRRDGQSDRLTDGRTDGWTDHHVGVSDGLDLEDVELARELVEDQPRLRRRRRGGAAES